jgi:hypothetical protein
LCVRQTRGGVRNEGLGFPLRSWTSVLFVLQPRVTIGFRSATMNDQEWPPAIGPDVAQEGEVRGPVRRPGRRLLGRGPSITRKEGREPVFSRGPNSQHEQYFLCFLF